MDYYFYDYDGAQTFNEEDIYYDADATAPVEELTYSDTVRCMQSSVLQVSGYMGILLSCSLVNRLLWHCLWHRFGVRGEWMQHCTALLCGLTTLYLTTGHECLIVLFLAVMTYVIMLLLEYHKISSIGLKVAIITIGSHFIYELLWNKPESWQRIRGIQMIATMKIVSLAYDLESVGEKEKSTPVPPLVPYLGYIFCPATVALGPWIPYSVYLQGLSVSNSGNARSCLWSMLNIAGALIFLSISNCVAPMMFDESAAIWLRTYRDALSVRSSHYFICFLSQATLIAGGLSLRLNDVTPNALLGHVVTKPWRIEFPRSLSSIVRNWNIPMHDWLKAYVFRSAYVRSENYLVAILTTYIVSSLLHGFHFKIYAVLLSLGYYTYVENVLRDKLASIFDACIAANPCRGQKCPYKHCTNKRMVVLVNLMFSALSIFHLAYLGIMMNLSETEEETQENFESSLGLWKWANLNYLSHWVAFATFVFYLLI